LFHYPNCLGAYDGDIRFAFQKIYVCFFSDAETKGEGKMGDLSAPGKESCHRFREIRVFACDPLSCNTIDKTSRKRGDASRAFKGCGGRKDEDGGEVMIIHGIQVLRTIFRREVGYDGASEAAIRHNSDKTLHTESERDFVLAHYEKRDIKGPGNFFDKFETVLYGHSAL